MEKSIITDINQLDLSRHYSIADYLSWLFEEMVELIRGKVVRMAPAPNSDHAEISGRTQPYTPNEKVPVKVFPDLEIDLKEVFVEKKKKHR